jgi:hypothetical protein
MTNFTDFTALLQEAGLSDSLKLTSTIDREIEPALRYSRLDRYDIVLLQSDQLEHILDWATKRQDVELYFGMGMLCIGWYCL